MYWTNDYNEIYCKSELNHTVVYVGLTDPHCGELSLCAEVITSAFLFLIFSKRY
ncbi:MAG: hypothetical protein J6K61_03870 [Clostridia bacterium]|nr:hypothetical protein [Clostridia bacterium]MBP3437030.1 hypothetical protein [Clostridia bacterium]